MKAWIYRRYSGPNEPLALERVEEYAKPSADSLCDGQILVEMRCTSVNPVDYKVMEGNFKYAPTFLGAPPFRPEGTIPCMDGAGVVVASKSPLFKVGEAVCFDNGAPSGALAEYCVVNDTKAALKPPNASWPEATANVGLASGTAVQGSDWLINMLERNLNKPYTILVLGGGGGVGSAAICYLKALGHRVIVTASSRNHEWCIRRGADRCIDYTKENWWEVLSPNEVHGVFQTVGQLEDFPMAESSGVVVQNGAFVSCARPIETGMLTSIFQTAWRKMFASLSFDFFLNAPCTERLQKLSNLVAQGQFPSNLGIVFEFDKADEAFALVRSGKATGKVVIEIARK